MSGLLMLTTKACASALSRMSELIKQKIALCQESLDGLEKIFPETYEGLFSDDKTLPAIERYFQLVVDAAVDCNNLILEAANAPREETYFGTFTALRDRSLMPSTILNALAPSVGLRNALVHRYETIDRERMYESMKKFIRLYREYLKVLAERHL